MSDRDIPRTSSMEYVLCCQRCGSLLCRAGDLMEDSVNQDPACGSYFLRDPLDWMEEVSYDTEGKLSCPGKCSVRVGRISWVGFEALPGRWIAPAIMLTRSKSDVKLRATSVVEDMERQRDSGVHDGEGGGEKVDDVNVSSNAEKNGGFEGNEREEGGGSDAGERSAGATGQGLELGDCGEDVKRSVGGGGTLEGVGRKVGGRVQGGCADEVGGGSGDGGEEGAVGGGGSGSDDAGNDDGKRGGAGISGGDVTLPAESQRRGRSSTGYTAEELGGMDMVELVGLLERGEIDMEQLEAGMNAANAKAREEKKKSRDVSDPKVLMQAIHETLDDPATWARLRAESGKVRRGEVTPVAYYTSFCMIFARLDREGLLEPMFENIPDKTVSDELLRLHRGA